MFFNTDEFKEGTTAYAPDPVNPRFPLHLSLQRLPVPGMLFSCACHAPAISGMIARRKIANQRLGVFEIKFSPFLFCEKMGFRIQPRELRNSPEDFKTDLIS